MSVWYLLVFLSVLKPVNLKYDGFPRESPSHLRNEPDFPALFLTNEEICTTASCEQLHNPSFCRNPKHSAAARISKLRACNIESEDSQLAKIFI